MYHAMHLAKLALLACHFLLLGVIERDRKWDSGKYVNPQWPPMVKFEGQFVKEFPSLWDGIEHPVSSSIKLANSLRQLQWMKGERLQIIHCKPYVLTI